MRALLFFISLPYGFAVRIRHTAYSLQILKKRKLPYPVISVGNITLGGTGKTPTALAIAGFLLHADKKPVILSRGYGRRDSGNVLVVTEGAGLLVPPDRSGDEPALMASMIHDVPIIVGKDRYTAGMTAQERFQPTVAVLDDGYQHMRLHRDLNICLIDGLDPFGNGRLFPAGILRESVASLSRADAVLITRSDHVPDIEHLKKLIRVHTPAPVFTSRHVPDTLVNPVDGSVRSLDALKGTPVLAFSGIAKPRAFTAMLEQLGAEVRKAFVYEDHYPYRRTDLDRLRNQAATTGATFIVTTEKDSVKIREFAPEGIWALRIKLEILEKQAWERVLLQLL